MGYGVVKQNIARVFFTMETDGFATKLQARLDLQIILAFIAISFYEI